MSQGIWKKNDWELIRRVMQELLTNCQCWVTKHVAGHFATGKVCKDGNFGPWCNAQDAQLTLKTSITYWIAKHQLPKTCGKIFKRPGVMAKERGHRHQFVRTTNEVSKNLECNGHPTPGAQPNH